MSGTLRRAGATVRGRHRRGWWVVWRTVAAVAGVPSPLFAEPTETCPEAAAIDPDHADLKNHLGYSYRDLRQLGAAFEHYRRALELNRRHRGAHEYAGEAYRMIGDLARAKEHLDALRRIYLLPCEELGDLEVRSPPIAKGPAPARRAETPTP